MSNQFAKILSPYVQMAHCMSNVCHMLWQPSTRWGNFVPAYVTTLKSVSMAVITSVYCIWASGNYNLD